MKKLLLILVLLFPAGCDKGIVTVEGYEHAVAFCGDEYQWVVHQTDANVMLPGSIGWKDNHVTYVVNAGHINDPEVADLVKLAKEECSKFLHK